MQTMRAPVVLPPVTVAVGGVLTVANVIDTSGHELMGVEGESDACSTGHVWDEFCTTTPTRTKVFDVGPEWITGDPFAVYGSASCDLIRLDEAQARADRRLAFNERRLVDRAVVALLYAESTQIAPVETSLLAAIALLEAAAVRQYGGLTTILMPVSFLTYACARNYLSGVDGALRTCQGTKVAGYVNESLDNQVYITGQITLYRGPVTSIAVPSMVDGTGTAHPARALAERIYVPVIDCLALNVDVDLSLCDCGAGSIPPALPDGVGRWTSQVAQPTAPGQASYSEGSSVFAETDADGVDQSAFFATLTGKHVIVHFGATPVDYPNVTAERDAFTQPTWSLYGTHDDGGQGVSTPGPVTIEVVE